MERYHQYSDGENFPFSEHFVTFSNPWNSERGHKMWEPPGCFGHDKRVLCNRSFINLNEL